MSRNSQPIETESRLMMDGLGLRVEMAIGCKQTQRSFGGDENVLKLDCGDDYTILYIY